MDVRLPYRIKHPRYAVSLWPLLIFARIITVKDVEMWRYRSEFAPLVVAGVGRGHLRCVAGII